MNLSMNARAWIVSVVIFAVFLAIWVGGTMQTGPATQYADPEYAALMGGADNDSGGLPTPAAVWSTALDNLSEPFYDNGPNDKGVGVQLAYSLGRVTAGFALAVLVGVPLGFVIGMSPMMYKALNPFIQILKPVSPLAWMPLALYTIKDASASAIFVIFICSIWPILVNTAHGVMSVRKDWLAVAQTLEIGSLRTAALVILPAAAPTILTGMRISMSIAWLVIVAAEMLVGGTGIGYYIWNEWNNLDLSNVIFSILLIGVVGMALDLLFGLLGRAVSYQEV
jgi:nitrate/nitrite transport system permease protein